MSLHDYYDEDTAEASNKLAEFIRNSGLEITHLSGCELAYAQQSGWKLPDRLFHLYPLGSIPLPVRFFRTLDRAMEVAKELKLSRFAVYEGTDEGWTERIRFDGILHVNGVEVKSRHGKRIRKKRR